MKKNSIPRINLSDSLSISRIITGLWQIADMERDGKKLNLDLLAEQMKEYAGYGLSTFDMADHYGSAELISGLYNQKYSTSNDVQLLTKWVPKPGPIDKDTVYSGIKRSLDRLKMDSLDLLQFHAWNYLDHSWLDGLFYLQELKEEGLIKNIGVTNVDTIHLRIAITSGINIITNQISFSLLDQRAKVDMIKLCDEYDVHILAYGTLAGGFLSEKWLGKSEPKDGLTWSQMKYKRFITTAGGWDKFQKLLAILNKIAKENNISIPNIATKYILQQPQVASVIIGARLGENSHVQNNLNNFDFMLSDEELSIIDDTIDLLDSIPGDCGDEYRNSPFLTATGDLSHHLEEMPLPFKPFNQNNTQIILSGTKWEKIAGYSRAVRKNNRIYVSGTTSTHGNKCIGKNDIVAQTNFIIDKIEGALKSLGSKLEDIVSTRVYIRSLDDWEAVAKVHGKRFKDIKPTNTMIVAELIGKEYLVEIEAEAEC